MRRKSSERNAHDMKRTFSQKIPIVLLMRRNAFLLLNCSQASSLHKSQKTWFNILTDLCSLLLDFVSKYQFWIYLMRIVRCLSDLLFQYSYSWGVFLLFHVNFTHLMHTMSIWYNPAKISAMVSKIFGVAGTRWCWRCGGWSWSSTTPGPSPSAPGRGAPPSSSSATVTTACYSKHPSRI